MYKSPIYSGLAANIYKFNFRHKSTGVMKIYDYDALVSQLTPSGWEAGQAWWLWWGLCGINTYMYNT